MGEAQWVATVYGPAETQGSAKVVRAGGRGRPILTHDNPRLRSWRQELALEMRRVGPTTPCLGPVAVGIVVYVRRPKAHYGTGRNAGVLKANAPRLPATGRDCDKVARAVLDSLTGLVYRDDAQVCQLAITRLYGESERVVVGATPLSESEEVSE